MSFKVAKKMLEMGCYEVSLGDTIGVGTPGNLYKNHNSCEKYPNEYMEVYMTFLN